MERDDSKESKSTSACSDDSLSSCESEDEEQVVFQEDETDPETIVDGPPHHPDEPNEGKLTKTLVIPPPKNYFLPGTPITIKITEANHTPTSHRINPYLYTIQVCHGHHTWTLHRRFDRIHALHTHLQIARTKLAVRTHNLHTYKVPKIPQRPEATIRQEKIEKRKQRLERFLQSVMAIDVYRSNKHTLQFLEISSLSFHQNLGLKAKESEVWKRVGGYSFAVGPLGVGRIDPSWHKRWLVLKKNFVTYLREDHDGEEIREVMMFDRSFTVKCGATQTGSKKGLIIANSTRDLTLQCLSRCEADEWVTHIAKLMAEDEYTVREKRYSSFAPQRSSTPVKWYVDGKDYFADIADALHSAKEEIFITGLWLSPELLLKRTRSTIACNQLDQVLKRKADEGVKIYVLLYKEVELANYYHSAYTKSKLLALHSENIKVLRHPDHVMGGNATLYWAHHEKLVCIDQDVCFLGGLDLSFGRWDDYHHRLTDFGSAIPSSMERSSSSSTALGSISFVCDRNPISPPASKVFIGKDYQNPFFKDPEELDKPFADDLNRATQPRMPWHDIAAVVIGDVARDTARHFIQRWNFTKNEKAKDLIDIPFLLPKQTPASVATDYSHIKDLQTCDVQILRSSAQWSSGHAETENSIYQAYLDKIKNSKYYIYIENQFFITALPERNVENKLGDALVERITRAHRLNETFRVYVVMPLLPGFSGKIGESSGNMLCFVVYWNLQSIRCIIEQLIQNGIDNPSDYIFFSGLRTFEDFHAKKFTEVVYVHSKLMIVDDDVAIIGSANINDRSMLGNRDSEVAICIEDTEKIPSKMNGEDVLVGRFAHSLRVHLFQEHLGLLDENFDGPCDSAILVPSECLCNPDLSTKRAVPASSSIPKDDARRKSSFIGLDDESFFEEQSSNNFQKQDNDSVNITDILNTSQGVKFSTPVKCTKSNSSDERKTESANIDGNGFQSVVTTENHSTGEQTNSSFSEISTSDEDAPFAEARIEKPLNESKAEKMEMDISHQGTPNQIPQINNSPQPIKRLVSIKDPICHEFYQHAWVDRAKSNTAIYEEVFRCNPTDKVKSFTDLGRQKIEPRLEAKDPIEACTALQGVQGFLVEKPLQFLQNENLWLPPGCKESLVPPIAYT